MDERLPPVISGGRKGWTRIVQGYEYAYDYELPNFPGVIIRVYSSIGVGGEIGRRKGRDAIRVIAVDFRKGTGNNARGLVKSLHVKRVEGWRDNLKKRVVEVQKTAIKRLNP